MTCTVLGTILSCLITPAPVDRAALYAQWSQQHYLAVEQSDGLHVYFMLSPTTPPPLPAYPPYLSRYLPPPSLAGYEAYRPYLGGTRRGDREYQRRYGRRR